MAEDKQQTTDDVKERETQNRKEHNISLMVGKFPFCPICKSEANYKVSGIFKNVVECLSCKAKWTSPEFMGSEELLTLELTKPDNKKKSKILLGQSYPVSFWQIYDAEQYSPSFIEKVQELAVTAGRAHSNQEQDKYTLAMDELKSLGEMGIYVLRGIAPLATVSNDEYFALKVLWHLREEDTLQYFSQALHHEDENVRIKTFRLLLKLNDENENDNLISHAIEFLKHEENIKFRLYAIEQLREYKQNQKVIDALSEALNDTSRPFDAPDTASSFAGLVVQAAKRRTFYSIQEFAAISLAEMGDPKAIKTLVEFELNHGLTGADFKMEAELMKEVGASAVEHLIRGLKYENWKSRNRAAGFLQAIGDSRAVEPLIGALADEDWRVRSIAAAALGDFGDRRAIEPLKLVCDDAEEKVRKVAKHSLEMLDTE